MPSSVLAKEDRRTPADAVIDKIMQIFLTHYCEGDIQSKDNLPSLTAISNTNLEVIMQDICDNIAES